MNRFASLALLAFVSMASWIAYAAESTSADEQAISKIEHEWAEAAKNKDKAFFEKYMSEDFTFVDETGGFTKDRAAFIDGTMKMPKVLEISLSDEAVRVHGTTAVATGRVSGKDEKASFNARYTDTYVKGPDGWKAIAGQETKAK